MLLNAHSQIVSNGESMPFDIEDDSRYDCTCGKYLDECNFFRSAAGHMWNDRIREWDRSVFVHVPKLSRIAILNSFLTSWRFESKFRNFLIRTNPTYRVIQDRFLNAQLLYFANARNLKGSSIYMDGTKSLRRAQLFANNSSRTGHTYLMKVLHIIRDGRGFCYSYLKNERSKPTLSQAARTWLRYIEQVDTFSKRFPAIPILTVRYEDLCRSTAETVGSICRFFEINYEDLRIDATIQTHILGHEMRKTFTGIVKEDTIWREALTREDQKNMILLMGEMLKRFGYI